MTNVRFPGNGGIEALYHWSTGAIINPYTNDRAPAFAGECQFPAAVPVIDALGSALISVLTIDAGKTITEEPIDNLGPTFTVELPRYGVTAIVIPKAQ